MFVKMVAVQNSRGEVGGMRVLREVRCEKFGFVMSKGWRDVVVQGRHNPRTAAPIIADTLGFI